MASEHPAPILGRPPKYDWRSWTDGKEYFLLEGVDFDCSAESFTILVRRTARSKSLAVTVSRISITDRTATQEYPVGNYVKFSFSPGADQHATDLQAG
jgi:hypothetical protein